jgi:hypothetical protein
MIRVILSAALLLTVGACGAVRMKDADWRSQTSALAEEGTSEVAPLDSGDRRALEGPLLSGARALYTVERNGESGVIERWDVEFTAPNSLEDYWGSIVGTTTYDQLEGRRPVKLRSSLYRGLISIRHEGDAVEQSEAFFALGFSREGIADFCERSFAFEEGQVWTAEDRRSFELSGVSLLAMSAIANDNSTARGLLMQIVQFPSWWTWIVPTIDVSVRPSIDECVPVSTPLGPGWRLPMEIAIKGDPAFYANVTVIEPSGVLEMTAGVIEITGFAPDRPDEPVRIRFVGARAPSPEGSGLPITAGYSVE